MASGGGGEHHHQHPHLQQQHLSAYNAVGGMGGSPDDGEGQVGAGGEAVTGIGGAALVVHQPPVALEAKGLKKAKREIVGGEEKKKENPTDWSEAAVNYLLEVYEEKYVSLSRGNLRSNDWEDVARYVNFKCEGSRSAKTAEQCKWKMENLKRRYKVEKQRQAATGAVNSLWPFFPRMDEMLASSFKFVATSPENGSGEPEEHPPTLSIVAASPQRTRASLAKFVSLSQSTSPSKNRPSGLLGLFLHLPNKHQEPFSYSAVMESTEEKEQMYTTDCPAMHNDFHLTISGAIPEFSETEAILKKENDNFGGLAMGSVTIKDLQRRMADFARERDWDQFHSPRNVLLALVGEVGELSEIFQWKGEVPRGLPGWNASEKEHLGEELSDVLLYLVRLADVCEVDLGQAALRKLKKNAKKYPVELCKGTARKYTPYDNPHGSEDIVLDKLQ